MRSWRGLGLILGMLLAVLAIGGIAPASGDIGSLDLDREAGMHEVICVTNDAMLDALDVGSGGGGPALRPEATMSISTEQTATENANAAHSTAIQCATSEPSTSSGPHSSTDRLSSQEIADAVPISAATACTG